MSGVPGSAKFHDLGRAAVGFTLVVGLFALVGAVMIASPGPGAGDIPIEGRVLAAGGAPLAEAEVLLVSSPDPVQRTKLAETATPPKPVTKVVTDAQGRFRIMAPSAGLYRVRAQASGLVPIEIPLEPLIEAIDLPDAEISSDMGLTVKVLGCEGQPVPGARVRLSGSSPAASSFSRTARWDPSEQTALTDPNGVVRLLRADAGSTVLCVSAPGYLTQERRNVRGTAAVVTLTTGLDRAIKVVSADASPAPDVLVLDGDTNQPLGFTDAQGAMTVTVPKGGLLALSLVAPDGRRVQGQVTSKSASAAAAASAKASGAPSKDGSAVAPPPPRTFTLPARVAVTGRVIDGRDRRPLAGALVWKRDELQGASVTNSAGQYTLRAPVGQNIDISAGAPGYLGEAVDSFSVGAEPRPAPTIALLPGATIEGIVVDETGQPVAGANATLSQKQEPGRFIIRMGGEPPAPRAVTSPRGTFRISPVDPKNNYEMKVVAKGFASATKTIVGLEARRTMGGVKVELSRGQMITGAVTDAEGHPLRDASITVKASRKRQGPGPMMMMDGGASASPTAKASTDAQGRFQILGVASGTYDVEATKSGYAKKTQAAVEVPKKPEPVDVGALVLEPGARVNGVVSNVDGQPIEGVEVSIASPNAGPAMMLGSRGPQAPPAAVTAQDGRFAIEDLHGGDPISLTFTRTGYIQSQESGVTPPRTEPLAITLKPSSKVSGRVVDKDKKPIPFADVTLTRTQSGGIGGEVMIMKMRSSAKADDQGFFEFEDIKPGQVELDAVASGWQEASLDGVTVPEGKDVENLEIPLTRGAIVTGRVLAPDGKPAIGARVSEVKEESEPMMRMDGVSTDGDGNYRLEGLPPGRTSIQANHDNYVRTVKEIEARPGTNALDLQFEGGQEISGLVSDPGGNPVAGATVQLTSVGRPWGGPEGKSGADGTFKIEGVGDGDYQIAANREGFAPYQDPDTTVHVAGKPVAGLKVSLSAGGRIVGTVKGLDPQTMPQVEIRAWNQERMGSASATPDRQGAFKMENLMPGRWVLDAAVPNTGQQTRGNAVLDADTPEVGVELQFGGGLTLSGKALLGDDPIKGASVFARGTDVDHSGWTRTGSDGAFKMEGLEPGTYHVELQQWDTGLSYDENFEVRSSRDVTLKVPTAAIVGRIVDNGDQRPLSGVTVSLAPQGGSGTSTSSGRTLGPRAATSDLNGRFELANVGDGSWTITANKTGYAAGTTDVNVDGGDAPNNVRVALDPTDGVTLEVHLPSGRVPDTIEAAVLDSSGRSVTGGTYATGENGRVRLSSVPPGSWDLVVSASGSGSMSAHIVVPGQTMSLALPPPCALKVTVPDLAGTNMAATATIKGTDGTSFRELSWMSETVSQWRLSGGKLELNTLPPGSWTVQVAAGDGRTWTGNSSTTPGAPAEVTLR